MKRLTCDIQIGAYSFRYVTEVELSSSWEDLTDTGTLSLPRRLEWQGSTLTVDDGILRRGQPVQIDLGYDNELVRAFSGYVAKLLPETPIVLELEDEMWQLKQSVHTISFKEVSLEVLLSQICPIPYQAQNVQLGPLRLTNASTAEVLQYLKEDYGLYSWVRNGTLYAGLAYWPELANRHTLRWGRNVIDSDLAYRRPEDVKVQAKAISIQPDNSKREVTVGDAGGDTITLHFYDLSESELKAAAERELSRRNFGGYEGSIEILGQPFIEHGDIVTLDDPAYPDRVGQYLVERVTRSFGQGGYRQTIELGGQV